MEGIIDKTIKIALYLLVFLLPIFFLPLTIFPVAWNKQLLLAVICFLVSILWLVKIIKTGKVNLVWNKVSLMVLILLVVLGISTFFSTAKAQSFWGNSIEEDSFLNFILYGLTFFLFSNLISKEKVLRVIKLFLLSSGILALLFLVQGVFGSVFPWDFAKLNGFNPVGSVQALAVFFGGAFVVLVNIMANLDSHHFVFKTLDKIFGLIIGLLLFVGILLINFWAVWLVIAFVMIIILWIKLKSLGHKKEIGLRDYILPVVVFAIALIFIFIKIPLSNILDLPSEITLTHKAGFDISKKTLGEGAKNFVFGSGPATFVYDYPLHRSVNINLTNFWQLRFDQGPSALITLLATSGILGILAVLFLIGVFIYFGLKNISANQPTSAKISVLVGGAYFLIMWIFYSIDFSLMFAGFLMLGLWMASLDKKREISLVNPPQKAFFSMLGAIILIVVLVAGFYIYIQKYDGALKFAKGLDLLNAEQPDLDKGIVNIGRACNLAKTNDNYFRNLSQALLFKITETLNNQNLSQEKRQAELQGYVSNIELSVQKTIQINPKNSLNWMQAGNIYENLIFLVGGADQLAVFNYKEAEKLDPQNPQIPFNIGRAYKTIAQRIQDEDGRKQALELAIDNLQKSIKLKYNFTPTYYLLGQVYEMKEDKELAIKSYQIVLQLEPGNEEVINKIKELTE